MADPLTWLAVALLVLGVIGSVVPLLPGAALSLAGVYLYWWHTGYAEPGPLALIAFTAVGLVAVVVDYFGGAIAAGAGGASRTTVAASAVVGGVLFLFAGPVGGLLGVAGTALALEFRRAGDLRRGLRVAAFATVGVLGSTLVQLLVTVSMLIAFLLVVFT